MQAFLTDHAALISLSILGLMFVGFFLERLPAAAMAMVGAGVFLMLGFLDEKGALSAFSNSAPITIGAMFILAASLRRTGVLDAMAASVLQVADKSAVGALLLLGTIVSVASAFVNNTAVVVILLPIVIELSQRLKISEKKLLIPLSYISILAGTCTLIGTSTNLLVAGVAQENGLAPFGIFEITPIGLVTFASGLVILLGLGWLLLPRSEGDVARPALDSSYLTDVYVREESPAAGKLVSDVPELAKKGINVISLFRGNRRLAVADQESILKAGDRITLRADLQELLTMVDSGLFRIGIKLRQLEGGAEEHAQATVTPNDPNIGRRVSEMTYLSRHAVTVRGLTRFGSLPGPDLASARVKAGDRMIIDGTPGELRDLAAAGALVVDTSLKVEPFRRKRGPLAIAILVAVILSSAVFGVPLLITSLIGVGAVLAFGCLTLNDAFEAMDAGVLTLIVAMLMVGQGLQSAGGVEALVSVLQPVLVMASPFWLVLMVYLLTSVLTEVVTNAAVAVIMTPLVIGIGTQLGIDPRALVVAVMFGASASFASPIGYQTNTIVHAAGNYRFSDFLKIGVPMNLIVGVATSVAIYFFYLA
ncbi:SLC13 family permease [Hyphomonas oceanitis]|uniref:SLC13 family permease n=1 Tax=Hyphomonas oceanitis TaxID=81033 RepID=UPI003003800D